MTKEQARIRLDEIVKVNQLFHTGSTPMGYKVCENQPLFYWRITHDYYSNSSSS